MSVSRRAEFLRREAVPRRRMGEGDVVCGRNVVRGSRGVWEGGVVRYLTNAGSYLLVSM